MEENKKPVDTRIRVANLEKLVELNKKGKGQYAAIPMHWIKQMVEVFHHPFVKGNAAFTELLNYEKLEDGKK